MARNIILCCDGTSNRFTADRTNVLKLCFALTKDPERQIVYYHPGLGTRAPVGTRTTVGSRWARIAGLAFGAGLKADVADAYIYLMNHYRPGDRVYLFGFSRGAYTARAITSMLRLYGLSMPGNEALVPYAVDMMWAIEPVRTDAQSEAYFRLAAEYKATIAGAACKPHFLGLWDTVNSVGWIGRPLALPFSREIPDVAIARHALAIDEKRAFFRANWLDQKPGRDIRQVWFPGNHGDVGGGKPEADSALSKYALEWMAQEAIAAGLLVDDERLAIVLGRRGGDHVRAAPVMPGPSITGAWHLAEYVPRAHGLDRKLRMNRYRRRTMPDDACVHDVAWEIPGYAERLPAGARRLSEGCA